MAKGFEIEKIEPVNPDDPRGATFEWKFDNGIQITSYIRKGSMKFGGHFHSGDDPSKNPERLFVAYGKVKVTLVTANNEISEIILVPGNCLIIYPPTKHWMETLDEDVVLTEYRITHFDKNNPDVYNCE